MISAERLAPMFVSATSTLVQDFDLIEFLQQLCEQAESISGADAVGLMLADQYGRMNYLAASNERTELLELFQMQRDQGPCLECFRRGEPVVNSNLSEAHARWPEFVGAAIDAGFESVHAIPLRLHDQTLGALNMFNSSSAQFDSDDVQIVQALADVATISLMQQRGVDRAEALADQLQGALNSRVLIEQAKGAAAQYLGISVDEAFELLRQYARSQRARLTDVCYGVVNDSKNLQRLSSGADRRPAKSAQESQEP